MGEPGQRIDGLPVKKTTARTERLDQLISPGVFRRHNSEAGRITEQKRDALLAATGPDGTAVQLFVGVSRDIASSIITVEIVPTHGALAEHPDLDTVRFQAFGTMVSAVLQATFVKLRAAGYQPDTGGLDL